jgi:UDP-N-acetylmuramyl pentapeptide phosphotransferase/UDP-N-acetylglucosamine-1-phosphate transferase
MAAVLVAAVSPVLVAAVAVCWSLCGLLVLPAVLVITVVDDSFFYSSKQVKKMTQKEKKMQLLF